MLKNSTLVKLHKQYIKGTEEEAPIVFKTSFLCNTTNTVVKTLALPSRKIHITTRALKHLYDAKPAQEYDFLLHNIATIVRYPDQIYANKSGKRGQVCFVKTIKNNDYLCSLETTKEIILENKSEEMNFIVTAFRIRREGYLKDYKLLWDRKGGSPSS